MFKDFSKFNFSVIDVTSGAGTAPEMCINKNGIHFNKQVVEALGNTAFVRPLIDIDNKVFALQACDENSSKAMKFTNKSSRNGYGSTCSAIRKIIRRTMNDKWNNNMRYRIEGILFSDKKTIVFDLNSAEELQSQSYRPAQKIDHIQTIE